MSRVIRFPVSAVHLWMHPTAGGWIAIKRGKVDAGWPAYDAEWIPSSAEARQAARNLARERQLDLLVHAEDF